nr:VWA N-terminal and Cache domain containing protein [Haemonchus contortus]
MSVGLCRLVVWLLIGWRPCVVADNTLVTFAELLVSRFEEQSRAKLLDEPFNELKSKIRIRDEDPKEALELSRAKLEQLIADRTSALQKLTRSAEGSARSYTAYDDSQFSSPQDEAVCAKFEQLLNESDVREASNSAARTSGVHVNIESYRCDATVIRDFGWTGAEVVEKTMAENKRADETMRHQFIGTYSGLTRMYPRRYWRIEPAPITIDLYDPKFRPWFVNTESAPKDIVFLIDYSGSVKGPTMHLIKITMMYILSTLSPNDYFFGVYFNSVFAPILSCANGTFLPATTSNKKIFFERLGELEEKDQAHVSAPLRFSLDALRGNLNSTNSAFPNYRSGGHKLLMLFTDGLDEWPHAVMEEELRNRNGDVIRMFGYSMGYGTGQLPMLNWMACKTFGKYSVIDSIMDVKPQSRSFLDHLSVALGKTLETTPIEARRISWSKLYMEVQGLGPTITISLPIVTKPDGIWLGQRIAGIAGIDIGIAELTDRLPRGDQIYGIIVDNNGIIIYHPRHVLPATEVHAVRRSACYDASQVRHRAGAGLRVQYGFSDQRVYRLVGLIDSIPTIDLIELEGNSTGVHRLRHGVITTTCTSEPIIDGDRVYYCANLKGSPLSVIIVSSTNRQTLTYTDTMPRLDISSNPFVTYFLSSRFGLSPRWLTLTASGLSSGIILAQAAYFSDGAAVNSSCEDLRLPSEFPTRYYINTFVHTRSQIQAFFPRCSKSYMKEVTSKLDVERLGKENSSELLQFSVRNDVIVAYRSITDQLNNRLAVVGVQWRMSYANALFTNWTRSGTKQWNDCKKMDCLLVTRSGFVLASSTTRSPGPLARFDPQLFASLVENGVVTTYSWVDAQAECMASRSAPWSSPATSTSNIIKTLINSITAIIGKTFWIDLYYLLSSFVAGQPSMSGGICRFQRIKPVERCFLRHTNYQMTLNITSQIQLSDMKCARYARVFPVPHTTLTVIRVDRACPGYRARRKYPVQPQILEGCEKVTYFDRRPPTHYNTTVDEDEGPTEECLISDFTSTIQPWITLTILLFAVISSL